MNSLSSYETFVTYQALKLHFTRESYDYFKYNGKTNVTKLAFENRKDKWYFSKLSKKFNTKDELIQFLVANFMEDSNAWVGNLLQEEADSRYTKRLKVIQSLSYIFENDCRNLFDSVDEPGKLLVVEDGQYPILLQKVMRNEIELETFYLLAKILGFLPMWKRKIADTIVWPDFYLKMNKYAAFLTMDVLKYKLILKKILH